MMAGYTFSHMGSVMAFRLIGIVALAMCIVQTTVNRFMRMATKTITNDGVNK